MIFNTDPIFRARVWQGIARLTLGLIACYNALLGLTEPTSLTARANFSTTAAFGRTTARAVTSGTNRVAPSSVSFSMRKSARSPLQ